MAPGILELLASGTVVSTDSTATVDMWTKASVEEEKFGSNSIGEPAPDPRISVGIGVPLEIMLVLVFLAEVETAIGN